MDIYEKGIFQAKSIYLTLNKDGFHHDRKCSEPKEAVYPQPGRGQQRFILLIRPLLASKQREGAPCHDVRRLWERRLPRWDVI